MNNNLTVILGAGFSANAGMPIGNDISKKFDRDLREKFLLESSSEWYWIEGKSDGEIENGHNDPSYLPYSYIFNELVKTYKTEKGSFINYEDFYQFINDNFANLDWVQSVFKTARETILIDFPHLIKQEVNQGYLDAIDNFQYSIVGDILNYLIEDILNQIPQSDDKVVEIYRCFIDYINQFDSIDIFTLNHDLLLERILDLNGLTFSKGFSKKNSPIFDGKGSLPVFLNTPLH